MNWFLALPIQNPYILSTVYSIAAFSVIILFLPPRKVTKKWLLLLTGFTILFAGIGSALVWWVVDVQDTYGVTASKVIYAAMGSAGAFTGAALWISISGSWRKKVFAFFAIIVFIIAAFLAVNRDVSYYPTVGSVFGLDGVKHLNFNSPPAPSPGTTNPSTPSSPSVLGTTTIPGVVSHFKARDAWVYLPPGYNTNPQKKYPVVIALSGQPGGPSDVFLPGNLKSIADAAAKKHGGLAPVIVAPDQLSLKKANPMCVDSKIGNSKTYIITDVRNWILKYLHVQASAKAWAVMGFSQGATCAVQFASSYPTIFSAFLAISPETGPLIHNVPYTIQQGFNGSRTRYNNALPVTIMLKHKNYPTTLALYYVGADDKKYTKQTLGLYNTSKKVHMITSFRKLPHLGHNWNTGRAGFKEGFPQLITWFQQNNTLR